MFFGSEKGKTMNKIGWTTEQIFELTENLYKHHEDYGQGRAQDFHSVCLNCKCYARTGVHGTKPKTIEAWNRRAENADLHLSD